MFISGQRLLQLLKFPLPSKPSTLLKMPNELPLGHPKSVPSPCRFSWPQLEWLSGIPIPKPNRIRAQQMSIHSTYYIINNYKRCTAGRAGKRGKAF